LLSKDRVYATAIRCIKRGFKGYWKSAKHTCLMLAWFGYEQDATAV